LNKTELACRLHYHQLNFGNRRQSGLTANGARSERSSSPRPIREVTHSGHATPLITVSYSPSPRAAYPTSPSTSSKSHTSPATSISTEWCSPRTNQTWSSRASAHNQGIDFTWQHAASSSPMLAPPAATQGPPDLGRLLYDYADSSRTFFSTLANQFSQSPAELEAAFRIALGQKSSSPSPHLAPLDWPNVGFDSYQRRVFSQPQDNLNRDLHAPSPKRCTVSSLLNFEKDTGSHKWGVSGA
jgi:hypothetical protein